MQLFDTVEFRDIFSFIRDIRLYSSVFLYICCEVATFLPLLILYDTKWPILC